MTDELYNYIYDAMCWMLEYMDDISDKINPYIEDKGIAQYDKLDKAAGRFQRWYEEYCDYVDKELQIKNDLITENAELKRQIKQLKQKD